MAKKITTLDFKQINLHTIRMSIELDENNLQVVVDYESK